MRLSHTLAAAAALCAATCVTLPAQTRPCFSANDRNTKIGRGITPFGFKGPTLNGYRIKPAATLPVRAMRLFTNNRFKSWSMSVEVWSTDPNSGMPKARLAGGTCLVKKSTQPAWHGANFDRLVVLKRNTFYWLVWVEGGLFGVPTEPGSTTTFTSMFRPAGGTWRSKTPQALKLRLFCTLLDSRNGAVFGTSCASSDGRLGTLFSNEEPKKGNAAFFVEGTSYPSGAAATLLVGADQSIKSRSLAPIMPGCFLSTDILVTVNGKIGSGSLRSAAAAGNVAFDLPIPMGVPLGAFFSLQMAVVDAGSKSPIKLVSSNALRLKVF